VGEVALDIFGALPAFVAAHHQVPCF
jgi:hypothetical protein